MDALKMQGTPVANCLELFKRFDPYDMLREREQFAAFAAGHLCFNESARYHAAMFGKLVQLAWEGVPLSTEDDYWTAPPFRCARNTRRP